jgi:hypothetical protein
MASHSDTVQALKQTIQKLSEINDQLSEGSGTRPYKVYSALLSQSGTDAPTATVLENTIGDIVWSRTGVGDYKGTLADAFTANKTWIQLATIFGISAIYRNDANEIEIFTEGQVVTSGSPDVYSFPAADAQLYETAIEIRVYP